MKTGATPSAVGFNDPNEFLAELRIDRERVERHILRLTVRRRYGEPFVTVSVVATAVVEGLVVKLEHRVGEAFAGDEKANGLSAKTQVVMQMLTDEASVLGLEVRAGVYE
jgi:hypothetical protein